MLKFRLLICAMLLALALPSGAGAQDEPVYVSLTTNQGEIVLELDRKAAPKSVDNFVQYVKDGHYNGTIFHRVIKNFMIQGGGFDEKMQEKKTRGPIANEASNGLKNDKYPVSMARTPDPHSASAQFFINTKNNDFLNFTAETNQGWGDGVFGRGGVGVVSGGGGAGFTPPPPPPEAKHGFVKDLKRAGGIPPARFTVLPPTRA